MKFMITDNDELVVAFEREERQLALDFLESLELGGEEDEDRIQMIIDTLRRKPTLRLVN